MNILTKILIVVIVLLCIIQAVLSIQYVNVTANYKADNDALRLERETYKAQAIMAGQVAEREKSINADLLAQMDQKMQQTAAKMDQLAADNARLTAENVQHASRLEQMNASLTSLQASVGEQVDMNRVLTAQRDKQTADLQQLHAELRDTTLKAHEYARDLDTAKQNVAVKSDLLFAAEARIKELEDKLAVGGLAARGDEIPVPSTPINGRVTQVSIEDNVAQLNVGRASGVKINMRFYLYRGSTYVGDLIVAQVEPNNCAGILKNLQVQPLRLDRATTSLTAD